MKLSKVVRGPVPCPANCPDLNRLDLSDGDDGDRFIKPGCDATTCAVCLDDFGEAEPSYRLSACGHAFHFGCARDISRKGNGMCPLCRLPIEYADMCRLRPNEHTFQALEDDFYRIECPEVRRKAVAFFKRAAAIFIETDRIVPSTRKRIREALKETTEDPAPDFDALLAYQAEVDAEEEDVGAIEEDPSDPEYFPFGPSVMQPPPVRRRRTSSVLPRNSLLALQLQRHAQIVGSMAVM